jgi:hypothetical protein
MIRFISIVIFAISFWLNNNVVSLAQSEREFIELKRNLPGQQESIYIKSAKQYNSEFDFFFGALFILYKKYISSQDASSCSFTPSCSEYALLAIKKQGLFEGLFNFWDRFSRCNGMSPENYPVDEINKVLVDPVSDWHYNEK